MSGPRALRQSFALRYGSGLFLALWCLIAAFPIFWIMVMSVKSPLDAFAVNPLDVLAGPATLAAGKGLSLLDLVFRDEDERLPYDEVARLLGVPTGSIGPTRARCLDKLRKLVLAAGG